MYSATPKSTITRNERRTRAASVLYNPVAGAITNQITRLTQETIQEIARPKDDYKVEEFFDLLKNCPVTNAAYELKALRCAVSLGRYSHKIKEVDDWIQSNIDQMDGTLEDLMAHGASAAFFGNFVAEIIFQTDAPGYRGEWRLRGFRPLDPRKIKFKGNRYGITHVTWYGDHQPRDIPYSRVIHVISDHASFGDPYGIGLARRAMPWFKAKQLLMSEWVVSGLNQARGLLIGKADSNQTVQLLDATGKPMEQDGRPMVKSAVDHLLFQMQNLENSSMMATDLNNQITWQPMPTDANFFQLALQFLNRQLLLSQLLPSLTFEEGVGGLGNSGIASVQKGYLDSQIEFITDRIKDQIIEKVFRPLINWNLPQFKRADGFGRFVVSPDRDPNVAMGKANTIISAIVSQILPSSDPGVMNTLRELLELPEVDEAQMMNQLQKQIQIQSMQQQALTPPATDPNATGTVDQGQGQANMSWMKGFNYRSPHFYP